MVFIRLLLIFEPILNVFQSIFNQAWTLSAVKELDSQSGDFYSRVYSTYNCALVLLCSLLIVGDKFIAGLLYANDFYQAWQYAPLLTVSVVFSCLCGVFEGIFAAAKETKKTRNVYSCGSGCKYRNEPLLNQGCRTDWRSFFNHGFLWTCLVCSSEESRRTCKADDQFSSRCCLLCTVDLSVLTSVLSNLQSDNTCNPATCISLPAVDL